MTDHRHHPRRRSAWRTARTSPATGASPGGTVNLCGWGRDDARGLGWAHCRLCPSGHAGDLGPGLEGLGSGGSILGGGAVIAAEVEQVVDLIVSGEEALSLAGGVEALHLPLSSAEIATSVSQFPLSGSAWRQAVA